MIIKITNFGPIKDYTFDTTNDLTMIFGKNNIGKSYVLSVVYLIIRTFLNTQLTPLRSFYFFNNNDSMNLEPLIEDLKTNKTMNIDSLVKKLSLERLNDNFIPQLNEAFLGTFDSLEDMHNQFSKKNMNIKITANDISFNIFLNDEKKLEANNIEFLIDVFIAKKVKRNMNLKQKDNKITIYYPDGNETFFEDNMFQLIRHIEYNISTSITDNIKSVHYLPASRSGLYQALSAFGQIIAQLSKSKSFLNKKIELPSISEPLSDYFLELSNIRKVTVDDNNSTVALGKEIEEKILHGLVDYDTKTNKIIFRPENTKLILDLSGTSSMVSELSPIVSYLKYILPDVKKQTLRRKRQKDTRKSLVFIEEPEAHLHPEVQVLMMEIFAKLVKNDVKMIITSHSNYMFNKSNNLILNKDIDISKLSAQLLELTNEGSISKNLDVNELGIDDENFIDIAEQLFNEKMDLIDKLNA